MRAWGGGEVPCRGVLTEVVEATEGEAMAHHRREGVAMVLLEEEGTGHLPAVEVTVLNREGIMADL